MEWNEFKKVLPEDKQKVIVYHEGLKKELIRVFYLDFWQKNNRVLDCDEFCRKWKKQ